MAKRELIDRNQIEWYGCDFEGCKDCIKIDRNCSICGYAECSADEVRSLPVITEQEIVKPYLDKLKEKLSQIGFDHYFQCGEYLEEDVRKIKIMNFGRAMEIIDNLLSEQGEAE